MASQKTSQINKRKHTDPHEIEKVPEETEARETAAHRAVQAELEGLMHHDRYPQETGGNVQTVRADQREIRREIRARAGPRSIGDELGELVHLHRHEAGAKQEGHGE